MWNAAAGSEAGGLAWRAQYLHLTYGCGAYRPYEALVREAARVAGVSDLAVERLESRWDSLEPWRDASAALEKLKGHVKLGIVTNCSIELGRRAAARLNVAWDVIVTAEEAGFYKPDPVPYQLALARLDVRPEQAVFVAGSGYDLFGTHRVGLRTYWHNRLALARPEDARSPDYASSSLEDLSRWVFQQ